MMTLMNTLVTKLAWRNLWRNHRRTTIMLLAISLGIWAMIILTAILRGMMEDMSERSINSLPGHLQINQSEYLLDPNIENGFSAQPQALLEFVAADVELTMIERLQVASVITSERDFRGVTLIGLDPVAEPLDRLGIELIDGRELGSESNGVLIGRRLAERLETTVGRRIVITTQGLESATRERGVRVEGIYQADLASAEESIVYSSLGFAQSLTQATDRVTEIALFVADEERLELVQEEVDKLIDENLTLRNWREIDPYLASMMATMNGFIVVWIAIVFIAMSFGLANTFIMAVFERTREVGLMMALGLKPANILAQVLIETLLLLLLGVMVGNALAMLTLFLFRDGLDLSAVATGLDSIGMAPVLTPSLSLQDAVMANLVVVILGLLTSVLPAWRASRLDPIKAINSIS
ncbi:ABC transporter permease [Umboniibacter marinipuniceus]|uniref:ABC-type lipoprotein release transport system permease subunit n=1 Tax=Umboniibacter marinipuniceus TaxID=569599 RepID=A0A3M0AHN6_9GAMM|nr:ABC transporter permease [Umboniibacter marinipuniceus]RMA78742.1 ABC-type lipoprotein release transport system permease subunit [Umboniibacter marinipuniceus]